MDKLIPALIGVLAGAALGGAVAYVVLQTDDRAPRTQIESEVADDAAAEDANPAPINDREDAVPDESNSAPEGNENYKRLLIKANEEIDDLKSTVSELAAERDDLAQENKTLNEKLAAVETPSSLGDLRITFGGLEEIEGLRDADWADLSDAVRQMNPHLKEFAVAFREGRQPDAEARSKVNEQNKRLIKHFGSLMGELPTHAQVNGEFVHPINMVNILAAQLEAENLPLSDAQKSELTELGEEYQRRWKRLQDGYSEATWDLKKLLDEADLKQWFREQMFRVTTQRQKEAVLPPEVEGIIGLDLYSPGLMFQMQVRPVTATSVGDVKASIKERLTTHVQLDAAVLDSAEYIFDDWMATLQPQLQPVSATEANVFYTDRVIRAGKAQLAALTQFADGYVTDDEQKEKLKTMQMILLPMVLKQE